MNNQNLFPPPRRVGLIFQSAALLILLGGGGALFWLAMRQQVGAFFVLYILAALVFLIPMPLLGYRIYALSAATYQLERDGLRIRWGLRVEEIPLNDIEWVKPALTLEHRLPLPRLCWPGAYLGTRSVKELGVVEFISSNAGKILLLGTRRRVYAISPADGAGFTRSFQYATEMGSMAPIAPYSALPAMFLRRIWQDKFARNSLMAGFLLTALLFVVVSLIIPSLTSLSLGFDPGRRPMPPGPPERMLLIPILAGLAFITDGLLGMVFYRQQDQRPAAYLLWVSSSVTPILLFISILFMR